MFEFHTHTNGHRTISEKIQKKKKPETASFSSKMAGVTGFEPVLTVLETGVLPLTPHP